MSTSAPGLLARLRQPVGGASRSNQLVGGVPRVSLMPTEVREAGAVAARRYRLVAVVAVAAVIAGGGVVLARQTSDAADARLAAAQAQSQMLAGQLAKFDDVRSLQQRIAVRRAAVRVGSSTMIDWRGQISAIEAGLPTGYSITEIDANGATPLVAYPQGDNNLEPTRAATIVLKLQTASVGPEFSAWLLALSEIPTYADASANTSFDSSTSTYSIALTVHLAPTAISPGQWTDLR